MSLHVRESNIAALSLYRDTLGFKVIATEAKYYADGEDAYSMRMDLDFLRNEIDEDSDDGGVQDEGDAVGSIEKAGGDASAAAAAAAEGKEKLRKVKVGRQLGVGELVERNESSQPS